MNIWNDEYIKGIAHNLYGHDCAMAGRNWDECYEKIRKSPVVQIMIYGALIRELWNSVQDAVDQAMLDIDDWLFGK